MPQQANKLSALTPATVCQSLYVMPLLLLLLFLCCASVCVAQNDGGVQSTGVVRELPRKGQSGVQAYTVATQNENEGWELIRIKALTENLTEHLNLCGKVKEIKQEEKEKREEVNGADYGQAENTKVSLADDKKCDYKRASEEERDNLVNNVIPAAIKLHRDRLLVRPVSGKLKVPEFKDDSNCNFFTVPEKHRTVGFDADFALYVIAVQKMRFGYTCAVENSTGRPIVGAVSYAPESNDNRGTRFNVRRVAHEMAHALGFEYELMKGRRMLSEVDPIEETRALLNSTKTVGKAREHYGCPSLTVMELEAHNGEEECQGVHWAMRVAKGELMTVPREFGAGYYTALTMALFEDLQFYKANWGMEEQMSWGNQSGCTFLKEECAKKHNEVINGLFDGQSVSRCTSDRTAYGKFLLNESLFKEYQSTCNVKEDYIAREMPQNSSYCADTTTDTSAPPGSIMGPDSWCLDAELTVKDAESTFSNVKGVCAQVSCDYEKRTVKVEYKGKGDKNILNECPENKMIDVELSESASGKIKCPKYDEVCTVASNGSSLVPFVNPHPAPPAAGPTSLQGDQGNNGTTTNASSRRDTTGVTSSTTSNNTQAAAAAGTTLLNGKDNANTNDPSKYPGVVNQAQINNMQNSTGILTELGKDDALSAVCSLPIMFVTMVLAVVLSC
ncbi:surface protease GP63 [Trypanosoma theileri]|uniref:Leishmanolysin-like peptidase n=1 Tax=Trypanosoma theileri TaxID=67003 RepID=A0A1X0NRF3_9TRYP|nr:surface protease GP63 [Trypanosoma theileri]ORC87128.1 surface protease GP63 [Trypanosoma theileri]